MKKQLQGTVISNKMDKTITVSVETTMVHPKYKKRLRRMKKYYVHDEQNAAAEGNTVLIVESKPLSKNKRWSLVEVIDTK